MAIVHHKPEAKPLQEASAEMAVVVEVEGDTVRVQPYQQSACSSCGANTLCFPGNKPPPLIDVVSLQPVEVGDVVVLRQGEGQRIGAALAVFGLPVATTMIGLLAGVGYSGDETQGGVAGALAGLMAGILLIRAINRFVGAKGSLRPKVDRVLHHANAPA